MKPARLLLYWRFSDESESKQSTSCSFGLTHKQQQPTTTLEEGKSQQGNLNTFAMENITNEISKVVYHDYATEPQSESVSLLAKVKNGSNSEQNFPVKLHYMLSDMESDGLGHIVSWQAHGRSFTVNKPHEFVEKILPL